MSKPNPDKNIRVFMRRFGCSVECMRFNYEWNRYTRILRKEGYDWSLDIHEESDKKQIKDAIHSHLDSAVHCIKQSMKLDDAISTGKTEKELELLALFKMRDKVSNAILNTSDKEEYWSFINKETNDLINDMAHFYLKYNKEDKNVDEDSTYKYIMCFVLHQLSEDFSTDAKKLLEKITKTPRPPKSP